MLIRIRVNGEWRETDTWPGASLLEYLRDGIQLLGTKNACEQGECGSCSVWLDGEVVCACLVLAAQAEGCEVETVEALGHEGSPGPVQQAFVDAGAVQCGFCTPGLIVSVTDLLQREPNPSEEAVREALAGNLCRCTGYKKILDAVHLAACRAKTPARGADPPGWGLTRP
ncbi:MAG: (2Fe-2S)-binding protein [Micromonosporaceae bacterium]